MAQLFSRYESGLQFVAAPMVGSVAGVSGLNPIVDRLNSISTDDGQVTGNLITGSFISGTNTEIYSNNINGADFNSTNLAIEQLSSELVSMGGGGTFIDIIVLDTASGTNVDFITESFADYIDSKIFIRGPTNGSALFNIVYSGTEGNFASATSAVNNTGGGGQAVIDVGIGQGGGTNSPVIEQTLKHITSITTSVNDPSGVRIFNRAGSLFFIGSSINNSSTWSYQINGHHAL